MNQEVTAYINNINQDWQQEVCNQIRKVIFETIPNVREQIKYKQAFYTLEEKQVCVYFPAKNWVNVTFFQAESLKAPAGFFEPSSNANRKTHKIHKDQALNCSHLASLFKQIVQK